MLLNLSTCICLYLDACLFLQKFYAILHIHMYIPFVSISECRSADINFMLALIVFCFMLQFFSTNSKEVDTAKSYFIRKRRCRFKMWISFSTVADWRYQCLHRQQTSHWWSLETPKNKILLSKKKNVTRFGYYSFKNRWIHQIKFQTFGMKHDV